MHRSPISLIGAVVLTSALMASQSASLPVALAAGHSSGAGRAAVCQHRQLVHCRRVSTRRGRLRARSAASTQVLVWSWSAPHGSSASVPAGSASLGSTTTASPGSSTPGSTTSAPCANADLVPTSDNLPLVAAATLCLVNQQRALHGEHPLRDNSRLDSSATHHSQDMVTANYYDHTSPTGETLDSRVKASGYLPSNSAYELGENIDLGALTSATPAAMVSAWMTSPGHRANILNPDFVDSGVGVVAQIPAQYASGEPSATYTQEFGAVQGANGVIS